jgi:hypothetical protein
MVLSPLDFTKNNTPQICVYDYGTGYDYGYGSFW